MQASPVGALSTLAAIAVAALVGLTIVSLVTIDSQEREQRERDELEARKLERSRQPFVSHDEARNNYEGVPLSEDGMPLLMGNLVGFEGGPFSVPPSITLAQGAWSFRCDPALDPDSTLGEDRTLSAGTSTDEVMKVAEAWASEVCNGHAQSLSLVGFEQQRRLHEALLEAIARGCPTLSPDPVQTRR